MGIFLLTGVVLFGSFFISVLLLQRLADLISMSLWQTVPQPALRNAAAEIDHVIAAIVTAAVFGLLWRDHPTTAIVTCALLYLLLLSGGVARLLLLTRRQMLSLEDHQFSFENDQLRLKDTDRSPGPVIGRLFEQKHPSVNGNRWAFSSVAVELYAPRGGLLARNIYYDRLQASNMLGRLQDARQAMCFDLALISRDTLDNYLSVRLGSCWIPLLCGPLKELPPQIRDWWKNLLEADQDQAGVIEDKSFGHYLHPLYLAAECENLLQPEFIFEFSGLEQLVKRTDKPLQFISGDRVRSLIPEGYTPETTDVESALILWRKD